MPNTQQGDLLKVSGTYAKYDNKEEKRVIQGNEQITAHANGEVSAGKVSRQNHKGQRVFTTSPTSNKVDRAKTYNYLKSFSHILQALELKI